MRIVARVEWGAAVARGATRLDPARVRDVVLHHTTGTYRGPETIRAIQAFHQGPQRGWADVGYNFLVAPDGTVFEGRGWQLVGAHARNHNAVSVGVAYVGDGRQPVPVEAQRAIVWLAGEAEDRFGSLRRVGHRDVGSTVCPGDVLYRWWVSGAALPVAPSESAQDALSEPEAPAGVVAPVEPEVCSDGNVERPAVIGPRPAGGTALPSLPRGLRWGQGGLPRIPWLRR